MVPTSDVVSAAQVSQRKWRVPASVTIGQYGLESGWGRDIPAGSNNPFGIKARPGEPFVVVPTHETVHGVSGLYHKAFRRFDTIAQAFDRHGELIATAPCYAPAMGLLPDVRAFVQALGPVYATAPDYATDLLNVIDGDGLTRYDL